MNVLFLNSTHKPDTVTEIKLEEIQMEINRFHYLLKDVGPYERVMRLQTMANKLRESWELID